MMKLQDLFELSMSRPMNDLIPDVKSGVILNIGAGNKLIDGSFALQLPDWNAEEDPIPFTNESVDQIHMYHFLEHVTNPIKLLMECQRVLKVGGHCNILVPYYKSEMAFQDLDHKKYFSSEYLKQTFSNPFYDNTQCRHEWKFEIHFNAIIGIVDRNIGILSQIRKTSCQ